MVEFFSCYFIVYSVKSQLFEKIQTYPSWFTEKTSFYFFLYLRLKLCWNELPYLLSKYMYQRRKGSKLMYEKVYKYKLFLDQEMRHCL